MPINGKTVPAGTYPVSGGAIQVNGLPVSFMGATISTPTTP